jgi:FkbM family methyltransferase
MHQLRRTLLLAVQDSPLEGFARRVYGMVSPDKGSKYDRQTYRVMRKILNEHSTCIDVGAYRGEVLRQMLKLAPRGKVFAFEPIPESYRYISQKYKDALTYRVALSDESGEATFYRVIGRPARSGLRKQAYPDPNERVETIRVSLDTLDNVIPNDVKIDFIKIDVEGAELLVLRGGERLIRASKPVIVFEHWPGAAEQFGTSTDQVYDFIVSHCGLRLSTMKRWLDSKESYTRDEFLDAAHSHNEFYFIAY